MDMRLHGNYAIGKIDDEFYIFYIRASVGGVIFSKASDAFHTIEDAHLFLLECAKEESTPDCKIAIIEILKTYMLVSQEKLPDFGYEVRITANEHVSSREAG